MKSREPPARPPYASSSLYKPPAILLIRAFSSSLHNFHVHPSSAICNNVFPANMMIPDYFNSPFPSEEDREHDQFFFPAYDHSTSASSYSVFFPDQSEPCRFQMHQEDHQPQQVEVEDANYQAQYAGSRGSAHDHEIRPSKGLKITLWKKSEKSDDQKNPVKWMSSKMRVMKNKCAEKEDNYHHPQKQTASHSPRESTDHFSSSNSSSNNSTTPFRVCSDCNTTKTPLWRSGPKGPKSLCNACGIRQRKARRALAASTAAAAAAAVDEPGPHNEAKSSTTAAVLKIKVPSKEKVKSNGVQTSTTPFKKRCTKLMCSSASSEGPSTSHAQKKSNVFEDLLINLSKNLAFHRVFPQDEKEAAILLMAISSGLVHG